MRKDVGIAFYLKAKKKQNLDQLAPIYVRLNLNETSTRLSTGMNIIINRWKATKQLKIARKEEDLLLKAELLKVRATLVGIASKAKESGVIISAEELKRRYLNPNEGETGSKTLIQLLELHTEIFKKFISVNERSINSLTKYKTVAIHLKGYLSNELKITDIKLKALDLKFIREFDIYLRLNCKLANNTTVKYCQFVRSVISTGIDYGYMNSDPFRGYKGKLKKVDTHYLNEDQIKAIENKVFSVERLDIVRDVFLLTIYTGYAPVDIANLRLTNIRNHFDGDPWIFTTRQKTDIKSDVPLIAPALAIIAKYKNHPKCLDGRLVPYNTNQTMNQSLKEIGDLCCIPFPLNYYAARHTFATRVMNNGVSALSAGKMMGHTRIETTLGYGRILNKTVSNEMKKFKENLENKVMV